MANAIDRVLIESARARALPASQLAAELSQPLDLVHESMLRVASMANGQPVTSAAPMHRDVTMDRVLAAMGRPSVANDADARTARPMRVRHVMRPSVLAWALSMRPDLRRAPWVASWHRDAGVGSMAAAPPRMTAEAGMLPPPAHPEPGTPGVYRAPSTTKMFYTIRTGDTPSELATWIAGDGSPASYRKLMEANPDRKTVGTPGTWSYNFVSFKTGDKLALPAEWNQYVTESGDWGTKGKAYPPRPDSVPIPVPSTDGGGTTYAASLPAGAITAAKVKLGAWGKREGTITTYPGLYDLNDAIDEAFKGAVSQFQGWMNAKGGSLRTDGVFDKATNDALDAYALAAAGSGAPSTPVAVPPIPSPWGTPTPVSTTPAVPSTSWPTGGTPTPAVPSKELMPDVAGVGGKWTWDGTKYVWQPSAAPSPFGGGNVAQGGNAPASSGGGSALPLLVAALALGSEVLK